MRPGPWAFSLLLIAAPLGACGGSNARPAEMVGEGGAGAEIDAPSTGAEAGATDAASQPATLGMTCGGPCGSSFCLIGDPGVCRGTVLAQPCIGRTGMYCSRACASDADCAGAPVPMTCLTACAEFPELAGYCWSRDDAEVVKRDVCPMSTRADGGAPTATSDGGPAGAGVDGAVPVGDAGAAGGAVLKFCNRYARSGPTGPSVELTLEVGGPPNTVRLQAATGACAPPVGQACPAMPTGDVPVRLLEGTTLLEEFRVQVAADEAWLVTAARDATDSSPFLEAGTFMPQGRCSTLDPETMPPPRLRLRKALPRLR